MLPNGEKSSQLESYQAAVQPVHTVPASHSTISNMSSLRLIVSTHDTDECAMASCAVTAVMYT
jgi:hypothetical protein